MSNDTNTVTYTGVTNDLFRRINEHKTKAVQGFTSKYNINKLVFFEFGESIEAVNMREKQIKGWNREEKVKLIKSMNPDWHDLYQDLIKG